MLLLLLWMMWPGAGGMLAGRHSVGVSVAWLGGVGVSVAWLGGVWCGRWRSSFRPARLHCVAYHTATSWPAKWVAVCTRVNSSHG